MANILFIIITPGGEREENTFALVPSDRLTSEEISDLDSIDGKIINCDDDEDGTGWADRIEALYKRLGIEPQTVHTEDELARMKRKEPDFKQPELTPIDLAEFVKPKTPFIVDRVVRIGWAD